MLLRIVAELLTVAGLCLRLTMHSATGLRRLNDGRRVVAVERRGGRWVSVRSLRIASNFARSMSCERPRCSISADRRVASNSATAHVSSGSPSATIGCGNSSVGGLAGSGWAFSSEAVTRNKTASDSISFAGAACERLSGDTGFTG